MLRTDERTFWLRSRNPGALQENKKLYARSVALQTEKFQIMKSVERRFLHHYTHGKATGNDLNCPPQEELFDLV